MSLVELPLEPAPCVLPARARELIATAEERAEHVVARLRLPLLGYVPSDFELAYRVLATLRSRADIGDEFVEWGCGLGVVTALASCLGFEAVGIEIQASLVQEGRRLLEDLGIEASILEGSFLPADFDVDRFALSEERVTVLDGAGATDEVDVSPDDASLVYAFPWPGEEELYFALFDERGAPGAQLLTYHGPVEGFRLQQKTS